MTSFAARTSDMQQVTDANSLPADSLDCGLRRLNWFRGATCLKYANLRVFVAVLAVVALLQGSCETYFRIAAKQAAAINGYNAIVVDWLVVSSGIFASILALFFAHWSHKRHLIRWLGGVYMAEAIVCIIAVIPSITQFSKNPSNTEISPPSSYMCSNTTSLFSGFGGGSGMQQQQNSSQNGTDPIDIVSLVFMFVLQLALGLGTLAFYTIAIVYIDDNSASMDSPAVIAAILTAKLFGLQLGSMLVMAIEDLTIGWWLGWLILSPMVFVGGFLLLLFPRMMPNIAVHQAAQRLIEQSRQLGGQFSDYLEDTALMPSLKRLFNNKLLMFNVVSMMFIEAASINYLMQQEAYLQSRFFLPFDEQDGLAQEWQAKLISYFLQPPVAGVTMLVCGLIISKIAPSARQIAGINIVQGLVLMFIYIAYTFLNCQLGPIAGVSAGKFTQPYCSRQCICSTDTFLPVCPENTTVTYFSPCFAGCTTRTKINSVEFYEGCSCDANFGANGWTSVRATLGPCSASACLSMLITFQVLSVFAAGVLGMITISKLILLLRSVLPQDKALALAMQIMFIGLFTYIPAHLAYQTVTRVTCLYWAPQYSRCLLRENPKHGNILDIMSAVLIFFGVIFDVLVFWYAKNLNVYNCKVIDNNYTPSVYSSPSDRLNGSSLSPGSAVSPVTNTTAATSPRPNDAAKGSRMRPVNSEITVFRNPSSLTNSSVGTASNAESPAMPAAGGGGAGDDANSETVPYAEIVFPPDRHKTAEGTTSPKRMAVRSNVPLHHLSAHDVRTQLGQLKSFNVTAPIDGAANGRAVVDKEQTDNVADDDDDDEGGTEMLPLMKATSPVDINEATKVKIAKGTLSPETDL